MSTSQTNLERAQQRRMRTQRLIIAAVLTLWVAAALFALSLLVFRYWPKAIGSIAVIPIYGQIIWVAGGLYYSIRKRQPAIIAGITSGLVIEIAGFALMLYLLPTRY